MQKEIGILGLGSMGTAIALNLKKKYKIFGYDTNKYNNMKSTKNFILVKSLKEIFSKTNIFQKIAYALPLVYIFEETRNILVNQFVNYENITQALYLNALYLAIAILIFYYSFDKAREKGTLINIGE